MSTDNSTDEALEERAKALYAEHRRRYPRTLDGKRRVGWGWLHEGLRAFWRMKANELEE